MKTSVCQSLIDKGDPLSLAMLADGASVFNLIPVKDWKYFIFKVTYARDEDMQKVIKSGYMIGTRNHIEIDAEIYSPGIRVWFTCDEIELVSVSPSESQFYDSMDELKQDYRLK